MLICIQCRRALDTRSDGGGIHSDCQTCKLHFLSVGRLMKRSDSRLISGLWEFAQRIPVQEESCPCPRCATPMSVIRFRQGGENRQFRGCMACFVVAIDQDLLEAFDETHPRKLSERARDQALALDWKRREAHRVRKALARSLVDAWGQTAALSTVFFFVGRYFRDQWPNLGLSILSVIAALALKQVFARKPGTTAELLPPVAVPATAAAATSRNLVVSSGGSLPRAVLRSRTG